MTPSGTAVEYEGARVRVDLEATEARLSIDGITRQRQSLGQDQQTSAYLSTSWQTGYEWHEFIEARIERNGSRAKISIYASGRLIHEAGALPGDCL